MLYVLTFTSCSPHSRSSTIVRPTTVNDTSYLSGLRVAARTQAPSIRRTSALTPAGYWMEGTTPLYVNTIPYSRKFGEVFDWQFGKFGTNRQILKTCRMNLLQARPIHAVRPNLNFAKSSPIPMENHFTKFNARQGYLL